MRMIIYKEVGVSRKEVGFVDEDGKFELPNELFESWERTKKTTLTYRSSAIQDGKILELVQPIAIKDFEKFVVAFLEGVFHFTGEYYQGVLQK